MIISIEINNKLYEIPKCIYVYDILFIFPLIIDKNPYKMKKSNK